MLALLGFRLEADLTVGFGAPPLGIDEHIPGQQHPDLRNHAVDVVIGQVPAHLEGGDVVGIADQTRHDAQRSPVTSEFRLQIRDGILGRDGKILIAGGFGHKVYPDHKCCREPQQTQQNDRRRSDIADLTCRQKPVLFLLFIGIFHFCIHPRLSIV